MASRRRAGLALLVLGSLLAGRPAAADMVVEVINRSKRQVLIEVSGMSVYQHVMPGGSHAYPAFAESRSITIHPAGIGEVARVCAGQAILTVVAGQSSCQWVDGGADADAPAKCSPPASMGNSTGQCRIAITLVDP